MTGTDELRTSSGFPRVSTTIGSIWTFMKPPVPRSLRTREAFS